MSKIDVGIVMPTFAALRAAVFPLFPKTLGGGISPVGARVKLFEVHLHWSGICPLSTMQHAKDIQYLRSPYPYIHIRITRSDCKVKQKLASHNREIIGGRWRLGSYQYRTERKIGRYLRTSLVADMSWFNVRHLIQ